MSLQPELDSDPRENLATTAFERNPGWNRLKKYLLKVNWKKEVHSVASKCKWTFEKSELEILSRFLNSVEPKVLDRMRMVPGNRHRFNHRSKIWNCMNTEEAAYQNACHEAGHVVSYWFTNDPVKVKCASIVPEKGVVGRVTYEKLDPNYVYTNNDEFSDMISYMGGQLAQQMLAYSPRVDLTGMKDDLVKLAGKSYKLAKNTMAEAGEEGPEELMSFFFRECHKVSYEILEEHKRGLKALSYALFAEKKLDYCDMLEILGPRPQMDKTLYEEFIKDKISSGDIKEKILFARKNCFISNARKRRISLEEPISVKENYIDFSNFFKEENL